MIDPIHALRRQVRDFFCNHLIGVYNWENVRFGRVEQAEWNREMRTPNGERVPRPDGKWREVLTAEFGPYHVEVRSPFEHPPLGRIACDLGLHGPFEGPLTSDTWRELGRKIKQTRELETANGE